MADLLGELAQGVKRLASIKKEMDDLEFKEAILELKGLLLDAKEEVLTLRERNTGLQRRVKELQDVAERQRSLIEVEGFKYDAEDGKPVGLPYCPTCEVKYDGKLYRLKKSNEHYSKCPNCSNVFNAAANGAVHTEAPPMDFHPHASWI